MKEMENGLEEQDEITAVETADGVAEETVTEAEEQVKPEEEAETAIEEGTAAPAEPEEAVDVEALIAEAEARGYERGRNEKIEAWMNEGRNGRPAVSAAHESEVMILNNMRKSVWE